jgi:type III pantothenate kinase
MCKNHVQYSKNYTAIEMHDSGYVNFVALLDSLMPKTLCLDFGNTRLKAAVFHEEKILAQHILPNDDFEEINRIVLTHQPEFSILSSVVNHNQQIEELLRAHTRFHLLSSDSALPFTLSVGKPETMGSDRLAVAAAAVHLYPQQHNLVIVLGSCITYNFINKSAQFLGGSISPGMEMRFRCMHQYTAKLPLVKADWNVPLIGYDTATNLQSGVVLGMAKEIEGIIESYQRRYRNFNVLLTGGDIPFFEPHLKTQIFAIPDLSFKGLYAISKVNH